MKTEDLTETHVALQLYPGYSDGDREILREFANPDARGEAGFVTDFLGSRIRTTSIWKEARTLDGQVLGIPDPADFHAEAVEWIGLLKAARSANDQYVAMELGAGFGPWSVAGGLAAQSRGIKEVRLYAVEGDASHFEFLRRHFSDNGFDPDEHTLLDSAVGVENGEAEWPVIAEEAAMEDYGSRPTLAGADYTGRRFEHTKRVQVIAMRDLIAREPVWDLIHVDVQGHEVQICRSCIEELNARVRWMIVGTHSRKLDGDLLELMYSAGWLLEHEKPAKFTFAAGAASLEAMTTVDGTQVWSNPRVPSTRSGRHRLTSFAQDITTRSESIRVRAGQPCTLAVAVRNTGSEPWICGGPATVVDVGYRWFDNKGQQLPMEGSRGYLSRDLIAPGETDDVELQITTPTVPGEYSLWISMVQEGVAWFYGMGAKPLVLPVVAEG